MKRKRERDKETEREGNRRERGEGDGRRTFPNDPSPKSLIGSYLSIESLSESERLMKLSN
jgi:hypothetical protein